MAELKRKSELSVFQGNIKRFKLEPQAEITDATMKEYRNRISLRVVQSLDQETVTLPFQDIINSIEVSSSDYS
jgi:hypothetical protein